jgi:hypothetical protein
MRARMRRLHHSVSLRQVSGVRSGRASPGLRIPASAARFDLVERLNASVAANDAAVTGPSDSIQPRTIASTSSIACSRSVATQNFARAVRSRWRGRWPSAHRKTPAIRPLHARAAADQREQRIVQFIGVANIGPGFGGHGRNRRRIQNARAARRIRRRVRRNCTARARRSSSGASSRYAYGLAFRISCENGDGSALSIATLRMAPDSMPSRIRAARPDPSPRAGSCRWSLHQRMIGNANLAGQVFGARHLIGKHGRQQIVGAHALDGRRNFAAARNRGIASARERSSASAR